MIGTVGLARRAGRVEIGTDAVRRALKRNAVKVVIVASDRSDRTNQKVVRLAAGKGIALIVGPVTGELGESVGKGPVQVIGVTDSGLAARLQTIAEGS